MARLPVVEAHHDFVTNRRSDLRPPVFPYRRYRTHVNIVHETRIIRHYVVEIPRPLQRADDRVVSTFKDSNHAPFAASFYPPGRRFERYTRNDTISMHPCADILRRNENVRLARLFRGEKRITNWMDG